MHGGEADEKNGIDLLVEFEPGRSLLDHAGLWLELQELLGCKVDVVSDRGIKTAHPGASLTVGSSSVRDPNERLMDILDAIDRIERYAERGRDALEIDELVQVWMVHHIQIIGEAAARLGRDFHEAYPEVPWAQIVAMRNILVHEYFGVDLDEVWQVVDRDLPILKSQVERLLEVMKERSS